MEDYMQALRRTRIVLKIIGLWPEIKVEKHILLRLYFLVPVSVMFFSFILPQTAKAIEVRHDFNQYLEVITNSHIGVSLSLLKMTTLVYNQDILYDLLVCVRDDWLRPKTEEERLIMKAKTRLSRLVSVTILIVSQMTIYSYLVMFLYNRVKMARMPNNTSEKPYYAPSKFFYDASDGIAYELHWILQFISVFFATMTFASVDLFFADLVMHLCGQLTILSKRIEKLSPALDDEKGHTFEIFLAEIVERHEYLNRFAASIEAAFYMILLMQLVISALVVCLTGFQLMLVSFLKNHGIWYVPSRKASTFTKRKKIEAKLLLFSILGISRNLKMFSKNRMTSTMQSISALDLLFMTCFNFLFLFSIFAYCFTCENLRTESTGMRAAAFRSNWLELKPAQTRCLIMIMIRSNKAYEITAGKFAVFSLELFCSVLKSCMGYISMLAAVKAQIGND